MVRMTWRAGDWLQWLAGAISPGLWFSLSASSLVILLGGLGPLSLHVIGQQHWGTSYTAALDSQQCKGGSFQALLRLGRVSLLLQPLVKAGHRSSLDSKGRGP